jgi:hypothetical protein
MFLLYSNIVPERLSTPDQAEALADALCTAAQEAPLVEPPDGGGYARHSLASVLLTPELSRFLPGPSPPETVGTTVTDPVDGTMPRPTVRVSWDFNPVGQELEGRDELPGWRFVTTQRGFLFSVWRVERNPDVILRASGMYDQLRDFLPPIGAPIEELMERMYEAGLLLGMASEKAEIEAWERVEAGISSPDVTFDEAEAVIGFVRSLPTQNGQAFHL